MSREWEPGDVADLTYSFADGGRAIRVNGGNCPAFHYSGHHWHFANGSHGLGDAAIEIRPLVVIDPEDAEQVKRLIRGFWANGNDDCDDVRAMTDALREFADPKPPKPAEPTGKWAVVSDANDYAWMRSAWGSGHRQWNKCGTAHFADWAEIDVVEVLSEGVQS